MGRHKSNGAGTYHGKHYKKEQWLKKKFKLIFGCMDKVNQRVIHDPPCKGTIDIEVIRNAVKNVREERQDNG